MKMIEVLLILAIAVMPWCVNLYKFTECDFESDFKCEILHGAGIVIPVAALVTVWFDSDIK